MYFCDSATYHTPKTINWDVLQHTRICQLTFQYRTQNRIPISIFVHTCINNIIELKKKTHLQIYLIMYIRLWIVLLTGKNNNNAPKTSFLHHTCSDKAGVLHGLISSRLPDRFNVLWPTDFPFSVPLHTFWDLRAYQHVFPRPLPKLPSSRMWTLSLPRMPARFWDNFLSAPSVSLDVGLFVLHPFFVPNLTGLKRNLVACVDGSFHLACFSFTHQLVINNFSFAGGLTNTLLVFNNLSLSISWRWSYYKCVWPFFL